MSSKLFQKMITINSARSYIGLMGLFPATTFFGHLVKIGKYIFFSLCMFGVTGPSFAYLLDNLDNMSKATHATYCVAATGMNLALYWYIIINQSEIWMILDRLQALVNAS